MAKAREVATGMNYVMTGHAKKRWRERVKCPPPRPETLNAIIAKAVRVQKFNRMYGLGNRKMTKMALYWDPGRDIVFKVDENCNFCGLRKVVTVLTPNAVED